MTIRNLKCFKDSWNWEGKVLIQENGNFEGIIEESDKNIYIYGILDTMQDTMLFKAIVPEEYPFDIDVYRGLRVGNTNQYEGVCIGISDGDVELCSIMTERLLDPELEISQIEELQYIIKNHKGTMNERYNCELDMVRSYSTVDEEQRNHLRQKLKKQGHLHYYL